MSMKFRQYSALGGCLLFVFITHTSAQVMNIRETQRTDPDIAVLRQQLSAQNLEIEKLKAEISNEKDIRKAQQNLIETMIEKLDKLGIAVSDSVAARIPKSETVPVDHIAQAASKTESNGAKNAKAPTPPAQTTPANTVESGLGKVKFTGLIQGWFGAGDQGFNDTFRIRRAELRFTGDLMPNVRWSVMFDPAKALSINTTTATIGNTPVVRNVSVSQASRIFQEAYITLTHFNRANIQFGQFKIPVSQEGLQSSGALDTVERALFLTDRARGGGLGDARDIGVMAFGPLNDQLDYQFGIFNGVGESQNDVDQNEQKAFAGRLVFRPTFIKGLQIGSSGALGVGSNSPALRRNRLGAEVVYSRSKFKFKSEFMTGTDGDVHRRGYYVHFGYRILPKVEGIFRVDEFDPDIRNEGSLTSVTERDYVTGINYFIRDNNLKLQFNYIRKTFAGQGIASRNQFLVNLQTSW